MAAIAKFISYDGGIAFSDRSLKIQKREDAEGRIIPISDVLAVKVQKPTSEDEGYVFVQVAGERSSKRNVVYYENQQVGEAVCFKRAFDSYRAESEPQERRQPNAGDTRTPGRESGRQADDDCRSKAGKKGKVKKIIIGVAAFYAVLMVIGTIALLVDRTDQDEDGTVQLVTQTQMSGSQDMGETGQSEVVENTEAAVALQEGDVIADGQEVESGKYTLPCGMELFFSTTVRNDTTGKWRYSAISSGMAISDHAVEYYETMFSDDEEIHAIWNASLGTMTRMSVSAGCLFVNTYEHVDGEEHDAKMMFGGLPLGSMSIDLATGEETQIPLGAE